MTRKIIQDQTVLALRDIQLYPPAFRATSKTAKEGLVEDWVQGAGWLPGRDGVPHGILFYGSDVKADLRWGLLMKEVLLVGEFVARTTMAELYKLAQIDDMSPAGLFSMMVAKGGYPVDEERDETFNTLEQGLHIFVDGFDQTFDSSLVDRAWMREFIPFMAYYSSVYLRAESVEIAESVWGRKYLAALTDGTTGNLTVLA
jgi:hypothetical protein